MKTCKSIPLLLGTICVSVGLLPGYALSQAPFYEGKTITIIQGRDPGGTGDLMARSLVPFLQKYIDGDLRRQRRDARTADAKVCP